MTEAESFSTGVSSDGPISRASTESSSRARAAFARWPKAVWMLAITAAVAVTGVIASSAAPQSAQALDPVPCRSAALLTAKGDGIYVTNKDTAETTPLITAAEVGKPLSLVNQVGVSLQGANQMVIFTAVIDGVPSVVRYHMATNSVNTSPAPGAVAGGINLSNGLFYFGSAGGGATPGHAIINVMDPATGAVTLNVLDITLPGGFGGNGDLMFDSVGNMYLVSADGSNYFLYRITGPIPATGSNQLTGTVISTSVGGPGEGKAGGINGIAFGSDGFIYVSGGSNLRQIDPVSGGVIDTLPLPGATDLGTCSDPNRIRLYKNLPGGRFATTDQFSLKVAGAANVGNTATTSGTANGLQNQNTSVYVGPLVAIGGNEMTISELGVETTDLANYVTTWTCIDESQGNVVVASGTGPTGKFKMPETGGVNVNCQFVNMPKGTLTVQKNLPTGRLMPGDQFTMSITPGGAPSATTTGSATGMQTEVSRLALATPGTAYTISEAPAGTTALANYSSTWECIDTANGNRPIASGKGSTGTVTMPTDGGSVPANVVCTFANSPIISTIKPSKTVDPPDGSTVVAGGTVKYSLTFDNSAGTTPASTSFVDDLAGVLDDATITAVPTLTSGSGLSVSTITAGRFTVDGWVPAGTTAVVTYQVKVKPDGERGDNLLLNFLLKPSTPTPSTCAADDPMCTVNPIPRLIVTKSVDPADGTTVVAGNALTYTLTFDNTSGKAPATIDWTDSISGVLDDATLTAPPTASDPSLVATAPSAQGTFQVTGAVPAGKKVTVTYKVQVKPNGQRGDNTLLNFLLPTGSKPPATCAKDDPLCTENPVPELVVTKSVDPVDGSTVTSGQTLTYTVTFSNARGKAPVVVAMDDNMTKVLDDATVTAAPASSNAALVVSPINAGIFTVRGTLAAGQTVDVTMKVQVNADGKRGDDDLLNFVVEPGKPPASTCEVGNPLCTENPVPQKPSLALVKSVSAVVDTNNNGPNTPGDMVTFAFKVTNTGNVPLTSVMVFDPLLGNIFLNCPQTTLAPGASMNCTGPSYTLTTADLAAGKVINVATVTGVPPTGPVVNSVASVEVPVKAPMTPIIPKTGTSFPTRVAQLAPLLMAMGVAFMLVAGRRRFRHGARLS